MYAKLFSDFNGDEAKIKASYLRLRSSQLSPPKIATTPKQALGSGLPIPKTSSNPNLDSAEDSYRREIDDLLSPQAKFLDIAPSRNSGRSAQPSNNWSTSDIFAVIIPLLFVVFVGWLIA